MRKRSEKLDEAVVEQAEAFLRDLPIMHHRGRKSAHSGGLNLRLGRVFIEELGRAGCPSIVETGAGCSSLLFLMLGCESVTSIAPAVDLEERIREEAASRGLAVDGFTFVPERSEVALPRLAIDDGATFGAAFIDGNHGWPSVFVDFCYANMMLRSGGLLFIDDVHVYACTQLHLLLKAQPEYQHIRLDGKMSTFRKVSDARFLPDWRDEPFIAINSAGVRLG